MIPLDQYRRAFDEHGERVLHEDESAEQDKGDAAESRRRMKEPGGKSLAEVRKNLGMRRMRFLGTGARP